MQLSHQMDGTKGHLMNIIKGLPIFMKHDLKPNRISLQHQTDGGLQHSKVMKIFLLHKITLQVQDLFSSVVMWTDRSYCVLHLHVELLQFCYSFHASA
jgi:hypothetical protein